MCLNDYAINLMTTTYLQLLNLQILLLLVKLILPLNIYRPIIWVSSSKTLYRIKFKDLWFD